MRMPIIRGTATSFDHPSFWNSSADKSIFRRGAFDSVNLASRSIRALLNHETSLEFGRGGDELKLWIDDQGLQFEIRPVDNDAGRLAVAGIRNGHFQGASIGATHSGSRKVVVGGEKCVEVTHVAWIDDISICTQGAHSFAGVCLIDVSQAPAANVLPFPSRPTEQPSRSPERGQSVVDAKAWHREIVASAERGMQKKMAQLRAEKLRFSPSGGRSIY